MPEQTEDSVGKNMESEQADSESCLSDEDEDEPIEQLFSEPIDEPSSESSPTTSCRYPLKSRHGGVWPPISNLIV